MSQETQTIAPPAVPGETIAVDLQAPTTAFHHQWEEAFGCDFAPVTLTEAWHEDLRRLKQIVDVQYIRFHSIFDEQIGLVAGVDEDGHLILNFTRVDMVYDGLVKEGVRPFVELSFMPPLLADDVADAIHPFHYQPNVAPPRNPSQWYELIHKFVSHLVERYGIQEVSKWYFEVWNEPNIDFLAGTASEKWARYLLIYDLAARAIKDVSPRLRVGGPSTAAGAWIREFIGHCVEKTVPLDFLSTHVYPSEDPRNVLGPDAVGMPEKDVVAHFVRKIHDQVKASGMPDLPVFWSETNAGFTPGIWEVDLPYAGAWLAHTIALCDGLNSTLMWWTFTDAMFNELGIFNRPFGKGFGLIATGGIPKPSFNAFKVLHKLGDRRLPIKSANALATLRDDGALVVAVWNFGKRKEFHIELAGDSPYKLALVHVVDKDHGNAVKLWSEMGKPDFPSREQQHALRLAAELPAAQVVSLEGDTLSWSVEHHGLAVIEFIK
jgi:xylan 1,4-beta-xylosidase